MASQFSTQNILWARQQREFTGRKAELDVFQKFLNSTPDKASYHLVISLFGDGGVGKSWLLRQMQQVAENTGALTAYTDESQKDLLATLDHIANHLEQRGLGMKGFRSRYRTYLQHIQEIKRDDQTPQGLTHLLGQLAVRAAFVAGDLVPGLSPVLKFLPQDKLETQAGKWLSYLEKKLANKDEVSLVLEPVKVLSPLFLKDISKILRGQRQVILFLDTYEKTGEYLDVWLLDALKGQYGIWPQNIRLVIAGREGPNPAHWTDLWTLVEQHHLSPFSEEEARDYLAQKEITDARIAKVIFELSRGLPLLVATLAAQSPQNPNSIGEATGDAMERFLKWVEDPQQRELALSAALPRRVNRDILITLVGKEQAGPMFNWLSHMPFVEPSREGWVYHDFVRILMLRYQRRASREGWLELHGKLADHFEKMRDNLGLEAGQRFENSDWQTNALEAGYHRLCQAYPRYIDGLLNDFVMAVLVQTAFAHVWADMIVQAERDLDMDPKKGWGMQLDQGLHAFEEKRYKQASEMFTALFERARLPDPSRAAVLARRGLTYRLDGNYKAAITDLDKVLQLNTTDVWALIQRGETYSQQGDYKNALADYNQAIQQERENTWAIVLRAETHRKFGHLEEALTDFQKAIEKDPENAWAVAWAVVLQSEVYLQKGQHKEAFAGFDRAVELAPDYPFALTHRGEAYRQRGNFNEALTDFNRAVELEPNFTWAWVLRGEANRQMGKANAAINDFSRAIKLEPENPWPVVLRGQAYRESGQIDLALVDFDQSIKLAPDYTWAITLRAETYRERRNFEEALIDFDRALQIQPENFWPRTLRGEAHRQMGNLQAALDDMNLALKYEPDNPWVLCFRSQVYRDMGEYEHALADCERALEIQTDYALAMAHRGETYRKMGKFYEALAELSLALVREPNNSWILARRGIAYHQLERYQESLHDFTRASLDLDDPWVSEQRQKLYDLVEFHHRAWRAAYKDRVLMIYYEEGERQSQFAALHLNDSYFRIVYGPDSGWGTSVILLPVYWSRGTQHQGGQVDVVPHVDENDLILDIEGLVGMLPVTCQLSIQPPGKDSLTAHVRVQSSGKVVLDDRPVEAFKPVMLSSMHISETHWDAEVAYIGNRPRRIPKWIITLIGERFFPRWLQPHRIPKSEWIITPSNVITSKRFGLRGGTSEWKKNAPTIIIEMNRPLQITGWVTPTENPNDDNVGLWAASKELLTSWEYKIRALRA